MYKSGALLFSHGRKWRNAEDMLPIPRSGTISLAKSPGALVRFTFHWCPRRELHSHWPMFEVGVSAVGLRGRLDDVLPVGFAPTLCGV